MLKSFHIFFHGEISTGMFRHHEYQQWLRTSVLWGGCRDRRRIWFIIRKIDLRSKSINYLGIIGN